MVFELLSYSAIALLTARYFSPLDPIKGWLIDKIVRYMVKWNWSWMEHLVVLITCPTCQAFWLTLFMTWSLPQAAIVSIFTKIVYLIIEKLSYND